MKIFSPASVGLFFSQIFSVYLKNKSKKMTEDYLHHLWKFKLFNQTDCVTEEGEKLEILEFGFHNKDSGPDFTNGKVKIGETIWVGNIEIHLNSSDWKKHNHQNDKAYDNVILHVVYNHDGEITTTGGAIIPTLELKNKIDYTKYEEYERFIFKIIPCINSLKNVPKIIVSNTVEKNLIERLSIKSEIIKEILDQNKYDWEQVFFQFICKSFGLKVNSFPMEQLAENTPFKLFTKLGGNELSIESILFGQAGMLEDTTIKDAYYLSLKKEYAYQKQKNNLVSINLVSWKLSKLRPPNFPTIRLAQLAYLIGNNTNLFNSFIQEDILVKEIKEKLTISITNGYWFNHYVFGKDSMDKKKSIGKTLVDSIIINTICPFLFVYGKYKGEEKYCDKALELLEEVKPEDNRIVRQFEGKIKLNSAFETQGVIQLFNEKCLNKKCLECGIGISLIGN